MHQVPSGSTAAVNLIIRPATLADLPRIAALELQVFETVVYPDFFFRQAHDLWPDFLLTAWQGDQLMGYLLAAPGQQGLVELGVLSLAVAQHSRRKGVGQALLTSLLQQCTTSTRRLWLTVAPENTAAIHLYEKSGFTRQKYVEDYYGEGEPRWVLVKQL